MSIVLLFPTTLQTSSDVMNYTVVVLGGVVAFSLVYFYFPVYGGNHWFKGPVNTLDAESERDAVSASYDEEKDTKGSI